MLKRFSFVVLTLVLLTACDALQQPTRTVVLPTLMELPTETPSPEITATLSPTAAPTETPTFTPSPNPDQITATALIANVLTREILALTPPTQTPTPAATATETPTRTPSLTRTPSVTPTPSINPFSLTRTAAIAAIRTSFALSLTPPPTPTPTDTLTPSQTPRPTETPIPTDTPPPTETPTLTPTSAEPVITSFSASQLSAPANATILFTWSAQADAARLETLNGAGAIIGSVSVQVSGQASLLVPANVGRILSYRLVVARAGIERAALLNVTVLCQFAYFFGDQIAPPDADCPLGQSVSGAGAFQNFERGVMIYVNANGRNEIYGMVNSGALFIRRQNGWDGVTLNESAPPPGLLPPRQMLNWFYYNTLAPVGTWNEAVGWAISEIDSGQRTIQFEGNQTHLYLDAPGGQVFRFTLTGSDSGTWVRIR